MSNLTEFQQRAAAMAVIKMLGGTYFSISDLDAIAKTIGRQAAMGGTDYHALHSLHCVHWADMGPDLARMTREKCLELLGMPPETLEMVQPAHAAEKPEAPAKRLRLAFWRSA